MTQKNDTLPLVAALVVTAGLLGGGGWFLLRGGGNLPFLGGNSQQANNPNRSGQGSNSANTPSGSSGQPQPAPSSQPQPATTQPDPASQQAAAVAPPQGLFSYGGSTTWAPIRAEVEPQLLGAYPDFQLRYQDPAVGTPGSGRGIRMLLDNQLSFSQSSRSLGANERQEAESQGFTLKEIPVALDAIAVAVNPNLDIPGLTVEQLADIYTGDITNWREVGGPDLPIQPFTRALEDGGTVKFFVDNVLNGDAFGSTVEEVYSTTPGLRAVIDNLGGIYYASAPEIVPQCEIETVPLGRSADEFVTPYAEPRPDPAQCPNQRDSINVEAIANGDYPISRRLFVIVREDGSPDQGAGEAYAEILLTPEGQQALSSASFVPIR